MLLTLEAVVAILKNFQSEIFQKQNDGDLKGSLSRFGLFAGSSLLLLERIMKNITLKCKKKIVILLRNFPGEEKMEQSIQEWTK